MVRTKIFLTLMFKRFKLYPEDLGPSQYIQNLVKFCIFHYQDIEQKPISDINQGP